MKLITQFLDKNVTSVPGVKTIKEHRGKPANKKDDTAIDANNVDVDNLNDKVMLGGKEVSRKSTDISNASSRGLYVIDPPTPEDEAEWNSIDINKSSDNKLLLADTLKGKGMDFFVIGDAGWAKTDLIMKMAHASGRHVITFYLDKCEATDLGGMPVPKHDDESNIDYIASMPPVWVAELCKPENLKKKWLVFFDEMNQAQPEVMNALMPIILKHEICGIRFDNIVIGCAGNESKENDAVNELSIPLRERLNIIEWETHTPITWEEHFEWAHKNWDDKIGPEVIDKCRELQDYWSSPRSITRNIYEWCLTNKDGNTFLKPSLIRKKLDKCIWYGIDESVKNSRKFDNDLNEFADWLSKWVKNNGNQPNIERRRRNSGKDANQVNESDKNLIVDSLKKGFFTFSDKYFENNPDADNKTYICTVENVITQLFDPNVTGVTAEVLEKILREMEAGGITPKYQTNDEARRDCAGKYYDPETGNLC